MATTALRMATVMPSETMSLTVLDEVASRNAFIGAVPVVEDGRIAGIVSERDVIYRLRDHGPEMLDWPVSRIMSSPAITTSPDTDVLAALNS